MNFKSRQRGGLSVKIMNSLFKPAHWKWYSKFSKLKKEDLRPTKIINKHVAETSLSKLQVIKPLGAGGFGMVKLVQVEGVKDRAFALKLRSTIFYFLFRRRYKRRQKILIQIKLVLSRDAFIASRERIFLGTYPDTVLSQIVYFLFILGSCSSDQSREKWRQFWEFDNAWLVNHRDFFDSTHLPLFRLSFVSRKKINIILIRKVLKKLP